MTIVDTSRPWRPNAYARTTRTCCGYKGGKKARISYSNPSRLSILNPTLKERGHEAGGLPHQSFHAMFDHPFTPGVKYVPSQAIIKTQMGTLATDKIKLSCEAAEDRQDQSERLGCKGLTGSANDDNSCRSVNRSSPF